MNESVLCVDDDPSVLAAYKRSLRGRYSIDTALGGEAALQAVAKAGPYAVIVSDIGMPRMDGIQLLMQVRRIAPDSVRVVLTGNADQQTAIDAVNEGNVFRYLTKPCPPEQLAQVLALCIEQHRLIRAEKELIEETLKRSIRVLTDVLALANPSAFGRSTRVARLVERLAEHLELESRWQLEIATMLSQLGCITLPEETLRRAYQGGALSADERGLFAAHPKTGSDLIAGIPRLEAVADIVACQERPFDGSGGGLDRRKGEQLPLGARILKLVFDYDTLVAAGDDDASALGALRARRGAYDPALVAALESVLATRARDDVRFVRLPELVPGMILDQDVKSVGGTLLIARGQQISSSLCGRLRNFALLKQEIQEPIRVLVPPLLECTAASGAEVSQ